MKNVIAFTLGLALGVGAGLVWCGRYEYMIGGWHNLTHMKCDRWTGKTYSRNMRRGSKWELDGESSVNCTVPEPSRGSDSKRLKDQSDPYAGIARMDEPEKARTGPEADPYAATSRLMTDEELLGSSSAPANPVTETDPYAANSRLETEAQDPRGDPYSDATNVCRIFVVTVNPTNSAPTVKDFVCAQYRNNTAYYPLTKNDNDILNAAWSNVPGTVRASMYFGYAPTSGWW